MFLSLWHYLRGYVIVEVSGYALEKFMNLALKNHITFWNVTHRSGKIQCSMSAASFKKLKPYIKKARCRIRILEKKGLPFYLFRYRKRSLFAVGILAFVLSLYALSSFVWLVEVEGANHLNDTVLIEALEKQGYKIGKFKGSLDLREAEQFLINTYPDIIWTGIKFEGTRLVVQITESVPKPPLQVETGPCNLVSKSDALITYIATRKGMPMVKKGDTVKKGDVLVSGYITPTEEGGVPYITQAVATVKGKSGYALKATIPMEKVNKNYTGRVSTETKLRVLGKEIPFWKWKNKEHYTYYDERVTVNQLRLTKNFPLPFYYEKRQRVEYRPEIIALEEEEAKEKLYIGLYETLLKEIDKDGKVLYHEMTYNQVGEQLAGQLQAIVEETIATPLPLNPSEGVNP